MACSLLRRLEVGASITNGTFWWAICEHESLLPFETAHGVETQRWAYNEREMRAASEQKRARLGTHDGFHDYFAPIVRGGEVAGMLVVGPFATQESAAAQIQGRWRNLTGRQGHPADPEFAAFLKATLDVLVLSPDALPSFERLLESLTTLMAGEGRADELLNEVTALTYALAEARAPERMWGLARGIVDERSLRAHFSAASLYPLSEFGVTRSPDQVLVGLLVNTAPATDPVDEAVRRHAFQRACAKLAHGEGETLSGQLGDHGAFFLIGSKGSAPKKLAVVRKLSERAAQLARKHFGFALHCGASIAQGSVGLDRCFQAALSSAELALTRGTKLVMAQPAAASRGHSLRLL
ncbi:MAG TPA: hypothetical protein VGP93_10945, partial [Polyangiaceae bacterium]|nr:hypothetical protein [Polyangiaceae bacterium]